MILQKQKRGKMKKTKTKDKNLEFIDYNEYEEAYEEEIYNDSKLPELYEIENKLVEEFYNEKYKDKNHK